MPGPPRIHPVSQRLSHQTILPSNISDRPGLLNHLANGRLLKLRRKPRTLASHYSSDLSAPFYLGPLSGISTAPQLDLEMWKRYNAGSPPYYTYNTKKHIWVAHPNKYADESLTL